MTIHSISDSPLLASAALVFAVSTSGCAHLPDAPVTYYLPESSVSFNVIRTVACDPLNHVVVANAVTPVVKHSAKRTADSKITIPLADLKGTFSDSDVKFEFYDDGRLKSFNGSSTGQGEAILKTVVSLAAAVFAFDGGPPKTYPKECARIKKIAGDKPLTLVFEGEVKLDDAALDVDQPIKPDGITSVYLDAEDPKDKDGLKNAVGTVCAIFKGKQSGVPLTGYKKKIGSKDVVLSAREPGLASFELTAGGENTCQGNRIWKGELAVAQFGTPYELPIPTPVAFGKEGLGVSFAESGALTSVQFTSNTGAGQMLNVVSGGLTATAGETTAAKAAEVKAQADLIAQQQRLVQCLADKTNCKP